VKPYGQHEKKKPNELKKAKAPLHVLWTGNITKIRSISFINKGNTCTQQRVKAENKD
jgi:hypothetical protein